MAKLCAECEFELPDDALICSKCGSILTGNETVTSDVPAFPVENSPEVSKIEAAAGNEKKKKWWLISICAVMAIAVASAFLWKPLLLRCAPQVYLSISASKTTDDLIRRWEGSPAVLLGNAAEIIQNGTTDLEIAYDFGLIIGTINADLSLRADQSAKRWSLHGNLEALRQESQLDLYLDADCLALRCDRVTEGEYYGLNYDTFEQDIRGSALAERLTEEQLVMLIEMVDQLESSINAPTDYNELLKPYVERIIKFCKDQEMTAGTDTLSLDDQEQKCDTISIQPKKEEIVALLNELLDMLEQDDELYGVVFGLYGAIKGKKDTRKLWEDGITELKNTVNDFSASRESESTITFYIHDMKLVGLGVDLDIIDRETDKDTQADVLLNFGLDVSKSDISLDVNVQTDADQEQYTIVSTVKKNETIYKETITVTKNAYGSIINSELVSIWDRKTGELEVQVQSEQNEGTFTIGLRETDGGAEIIIDDLAAVLLLFMGKDAEDVDCSLRVNIREGCNIETPVYKTVDQISQKLLDKILGSSEPDL